MNILIIYRGGVVSMYKYFYIIIYFLFFPISIYAYDKDINHIYENLLKEAKPRLERYIHIYYDFIR